MTQSTEDDIQRFGVLLQPLWSSDDPVAARWLFSSDRHDSGFLLNRATEEVVSQFYACLKKLSPIMPLTLLDSASNVVRVLELLFDKFELGTSNTNQIEEYVV